MQSDDEQQQPLLTAAAETQSVSAATAARTVLHQPATATATATATMKRKLLRSGAVGATNKSVYRWLNVRRLDRSGLLIFTMCLSFAVYVVFSSIAWLSGDAGGPGANRVVIVRQPFGKADAPQGTFSPLPSNCMVMTNSIADPNAKGFLVSSAKCLIPDLDPLADDVMQLFEREKYKACSDKPPLTYVERRGRRLQDDDVQLRVNVSLLGRYNQRAPIDRCCYQRIERAGDNRTADNKFSLGRCDALPVNGSAVALPPGFEYVLVRCKSDTTAVYTNTHAIVRDRPDIRRRLEAVHAKRAERAQRRKGTGAAAASDAPPAPASADASRPLSVLMLAIDSISRLNLLRAMPLTAQHLYDSGWFELQGYNKVREGRVFWGRVVSDCSPWYIFQPTQTRSM